MAVTKVKRKKVIEELRIGLGDGFSAADALSNDDWMAKMGLRFAAKLREEHDYRLASQDFVVISLTSTIDSGQIDFLPIQKIVSTRLQTVNFGLSKESWKHTGDRKTLITNVMATVLLELANRNSADPEPIESTREALTKTGEDTVIQWRSKITVTRKYKIEPYFKLKGFGRYATLLYVRLTNFAEDRVTDYLVAEADLHEIRALSGRFFIKNDALWVVPKSGAWTEGYRSRGFLVPIQLPLETMFRSAQDPGPVHYRSR